MDKERQSDFTAMGGLTLARSLPQISSCSVVNRAPIILQHAMPQHLPILWNLLQINFFLNFYCFVV